MLGKVKTFLSSSTNQINLIGIVLLALFFILRNPSSKWDKTISGDGKSYYAYLTTAFIYQDLDYKYIESYEAKYYPPDQSLFKEFRQEFNGEIANKTFPGISLLWLPFFLIAHFLSYLFGFDPDGYSLLYQYAIGISAVFYVWLGLKWLNALLINLGFKQNTILPALIGLVFATNLFYYTIHDPSLTHAYNFAMLAGILHFTRRFYTDSKTKWIVIAVLIYALAIITRPTNILMALFLPFAIGNISNCQHLLKMIFSDKKQVLTLILITLSIGIIPVIWWYIQTGNLIVYSYGKEGFDFTNPRFFKILFSYEKGWLIYCPILLLTVLGFVSYFKQNRFLFFTGIFGFSVLSYIFSCWWIWTYGASYGQRVFVDFYAVIGILLVSGLALIQSKKIMIGVWLILVIAFIGLNQLQIYQFKNGILPTIGATKQTYWNSYFKLKAVKQSFPIKKAFIQLENYRTSYESEVNWLTINKHTDEKAHSGKFSQYIDNKEPYSGGINREIPISADFIQVKANIFCTSNSANPQLIFDVEYDSETQQHSSIGLMPYLSKHQWTEFHYFFPLDNKNTNIVTYFWNPTQDKIWIDDLEITFGKYN